MKMTTQMRGILAVLLILVLSGATVIYSLTQMKTDGRVVNYSGILRGSAQRLVKLELAGHQSDQLIAKLDHILNGLIHGGEQFDLPKATDHIFLSKMSEVERAWTELKDSIKKVRDNRDDPALGNALLDTSEDFLN